MLFQHIHAALGAAGFIAVGCMNHDGKVIFLGHLNLGTKGFVFLWGLLVIADFTYRHHALFGEVARQNSQHLLGQSFVVGFFGVQTDGAVMADAKLTGAKTLKTCDGGEVVDKRAYICTQLTQPKSGFDDGHDTCLGHGFIVVSGSGGHVGMGVDHHAQATGRDGAKFFFEAL